MLSNSRSSIRVAPAEWMAKLMPSGRTLGPKGSGEPGNRFLIVGITAYPGRVREAHLSADLTTPWCASRTLRKGRLRSAPSFRRVSKYVGGENAFPASDESTPPLHYYHIFGAGSRRAVGSVAI